MQRLVDIFLVISSFKHISVFDRLLTKAASLVLVHVRNQVDQVDGEPGEAEDDHHGDHHLVHLTEIKIVKSQQSSSILTSLLMDSYFARICSW